MKKTAIIFILLISNLLLYFHFTGKLNKAHQSIAGLSWEIAALKAGHNTQIEDINSRLNTITANITLLQTAGQEQIGSLKNDLACIKNTVAGSSSAPPGKPAALTAKQLPIGAQVITATDSPAPEATASPVTDDARLSAYFTAGKQAFEKGEYTDAKKAFSTLLAMNPPQWEAHLYYIQAAYYENPGKAAADSTVKGLLDTLPAQYNGCSAARFKGLLALEKGTYNEAVTALVQYHSCRKDAESLLALGQGYLALKKPEEADAVFKEILVAFPGAKEAGIAEKYITGRVNG